jgi:plastocyanin
VATVAAHDLEGRIRITKVLTKKKVTLPQTYERTVALSNAADQEQAATSELHRVVVYIEGPGPAAKPVTVTLDQKKRHFEPEVVVVPVGSTVAFPNSDPVFHNVFSLSKAKQFDLGNYSMGETRSVKFTEPGVVSVHCHLHPNMAAAVIVTPNGWYARPAEDGSFQLTGLAPGTYTLVAWHKSAGAFRRTIKIGAAKTEPLEVEIPVRTE